MTIKEIFQEISSEPGSNKKMEILSKYKDNETLKRVLYLANSRRVKFYIKNIPQYTRLETHTHPLEGALEGLKLLSERAITGHEAIKHLQEILMCCEPDDAYIIERIIEKDCKLGMGSTNINKILPGLIEETPYMGAKAFSKDLVMKLFSGGNSCFSQMKMDGRYCNAIIRFGEVELESRQGETTYLQGATFFKELSNFPDCVLNGEITMDPIEGRTISRYEANGIVASLVSMLGKQANGEDITKEIYKFEKENIMTIGDALANIRYSVWDTITIDEYFAQKSAMPYNERLEKLNTFITSAKSTKVSVVDSIIVNSYNAAMMHFQSLINAGYEGIILKAIDGAWKDGKPTHQLKVKLEISFDLKITGFNYGTGKNSEVISSVEAESSDGLLKTAPTGINEKMMRYITDHQEELMGTIVECKSSGISRDHLGNYSMLHPVFKSLRDDKVTADSLETIIDIENMAKGLK